MKLSEAQRLALEAVRDGALDYAHPRTVHSLIARGLIAYTGSGGTDAQSYRITDAGLGELGRMSDSRPHHWINQNGRCDNGQMMDAGDDWMPVYTAEELDAVRRKAGADALIEAAEEWATGAWNDCFLADDVNDDVSAVRSMEKFLIARAARIARESR